LQSYSSDFSPADGSSRQNWESARRKKLTGRSDIQITLHDLRIEPLGDASVKVFFLQDYVSGSYHENARPKELLLVRKENGWKIAQERQTRLKDLSSTAK
jgi:hypothetical protein